jgi:probable HAF family extracellular repeat protein
MTDLGTLGTDPYSRALWINSKEEIVGTTVAICGFLNTHAFLWENGGPMVDLNTLIPASSNVSLFEANNINERGEIVATGLPPGCDDRFSCQHLYLLIRCNAHDASGCKNPGANTAAVTQRDPADARGIATAPTQQLSGWRARFAQRYHIAGLGGWPGD